jgi:NarL family two-component system response regulator LiaR
MDLIMPELNGVEATAQIRAQEPDARILVLTSFGNEEMLGEALDAGAMGCLLKDSEPEVLLQAIRSVYQGQFTLPPDLAHKLLNRPPKSAKSDKAASLTRRERQVMQAAAKGLSNREIGEHLDIGENTVRSHMSNILRKLNLANRTQLAIYALSEKEANNH